MSRDDRDEKFDLDDRNEDRDSEARFDDDDLDDHSSSGSSSRGSDDDHSETDSSGRRDGSSRGRDDDSSSGRSQDDPIIGSSGSSSSGRRGYTFELEDGLVTNLRRVKDDGRIKRERIEAGESWVFNQETGELVHSEIYANGTEVSIYTGTAVGQLFTRVSESFVPFSDGDDSTISDSSRRRDGSTRGRDDDSSSRRSQDDPIIGSSGSSRSSRRGYTFELENDLVTNLSRVKKNGRIKRERIEAGESWVFNQETGELVHSEIYANGTEVSVYTGPAVGEVFTRVSESFVPFSVDPTTTSI